MGGLAGTAAKLLASLDLDTKPFEAGARRVGSSLSGMESRATRVGQHIGRGFNTAATNIKRIGIAAVGFLGTQVFAGVRSLAELERVTNATAGVIESTGGKAGVSAEQVREYAQALENVTTADDKAIQSAENLLLTFTNIGGETFPQATKAVVDLGIAMAEGDVENANFKSSAIQVGKALNDPIKGITALTRVGVSFTDQQKEQIAAMVEAGDVAGAQAIILKELETEFGKAGEAAGKGFGADMRRFQDAVEDGQQALATGFLPIIRRVSTFLTTKLMDPAVQADIRKLGDNLASAFEQILSVGAKLPWAQIGDSFKLMGTGAKALLTAFTSLPPWVQTAVLTGWGLNKLTGGALGKIGMELLMPKGGLFGRGATPATPMFTKEVGLGGKTGGGGITPVGGAAKGGIGVIGKMFLVGEAIGLALLVKEVADNVTTAAHDQAVAIGQTLKESLPTATFAEMQIKLAGINQGIGDINAMGNVVSALFHDTLVELETMQAQIAVAISERALRNALPKGTTDKEAQRFANQRADAESNRIAIVNSGQKITDAVQTGTKAERAEARRDARDDRKDAAKAQRLYDRTREEIEANRIKAASDAQKLAAGQAATKVAVSATKVALVSAERTSRSVIASSQRSAADRIVAAIFAAQTIVNVTTAITSVVRSGGTAHRSGGARRP